MALKRKPLLKVILLGDSGVGKTSLMNQYINKSFSSAYRGTIGADFYTKDVIVDNKIVTMQIWDTVGQERFQSLGVAFYRGADCVILVFDVTSQASFDSIEVWKDEFSIYGAPKDSKKFPFVVLGNKIDLEKKVINEDLIKDILGCDYDVPYYETSAKDNINVEEAFVAAAKMALDHEQEDNIFNPFPEMITQQKRDKSFIFSKCLC